MTTVYLIRHAQTEGNVAKRFQGRTDLPVTPLGKQQIYHLTERMCAIPLTHIYSSPLGRAMETAASVASTHGLTPLPYEGLVEMDGGAMENMFFENLGSQYPVEFAQFIGEPHLFMGIGGGESMRQVHDRMRDAVLELVRRHPGETIAMVSHGAAIRCFVCYASGLPLERMNELGWGGNTSVTHLTFDHTLRPVIHSLFDTSHLQPAAKEK